ncbi:hypothetical protein [Amycolatopsis anabasis]|uniref:hypothetical protein n=1 Tax=Amycolatopsis anabasis TaxID=1840409 RepID=UPI00131BA2FA|nr:hypothetical protein [Amycolatopsis anabasis]
MTDEQSTENRAAKRSRAVGATVLGLAATAALAAQAPAAAAAPGVDPGFPDNVGNAGASFTVRAYREIALLPNDEYVRLRKDVLALDENRVPGRTPEEIVALKRSFSSNGCTLVPDLGAERACEQHDFRYTVGPTVYANDPSGARADREDADDQLYRNTNNAYTVEWAGALHAIIKYYGTTLFGRDLYSPTKVVGPVYRSAEEIRELVRAAQAG